MSNRRGRGRPTNAYATRVQRRSLPRRPAAAAGRQPSLTGWLPPVLAVAAEAGHLVAAYLEWPGSAALGAGHVVLAGLLGLVAAIVLYGAGRPWLAAAGAVALLGPLWALIGAVAGAAPYQATPTAVAAGVTLVALALAATLLGTALAAPAATQPARRRPSGRPA